jgi:hypothetical protein
VAPNPRCPQLVPRRWQLFCNKWCRRPHSYHRGIGITLRRWNLAASTRLEVRIDLREVLRMQFTKADGISISLLLLLLCFWSPCAAQDPLKVDPAHFRLEFENDQVRVVRVHFGPHYKSPMNEVPPRVVIASTDEHIKVIFPDGTSSS